MTEQERRAKLGHIWKTTPKDYRSFVQGARSILVLRDGGTTLVPLDCLTEAEIKRLAPEQRS